MPAAYGGPATAAGAIMRPLVDIFNQKTAGTDPVGDEPIQRWLPYQYPVSGRADYGLWGELENPEVRVR